MKKYIYIVILCALITGFATQATAQESTLMSFMRHSPQSLHTNPANLHDTVKWFMGIPLLGRINVDFDAGIAYDDAIIRRPDDSLVINPGIVDALSSARTMFAFNYDIFSLGVRFQKKHMVYLSLSAVADGSFLLPDDLATLLVKGNTPGERLSIESEVNASAYAAAALGYSYSINKDWKAAVRLKYLAGAANAYGKDLSATVYTDPNDYTMRLNANALVKTSVFDGDPFANTGFAIDGGVHYNSPIQGLSFGLSFIDWGWIDWTSKPTFYEAKVADGGFEFGGITGIDSDFDHVIDTLKSVFEFEDYDGAAYRTNLPGKIFFNATYDLTKNDRFGFLFSTRALDNFSRTTFTLMYSRSVGSWFNIAVGNNFMSTKLFNPSMAINLRAKAFQFFVAVENFSSFQVRSSRTLNLQLGMNLTFFAKKSSSKFDTPPVDL